MKPNLTYLKAEGADVDLILDIAIRSKSYWNYTPEFLDKCRKAFPLALNENYISDAHVYLVKLEDEVIGFVSLLKKSEEYMLDHMWLYPRFIGMGFGRIIFKKLIQIAKDLRFPELTMVSDVNAENFYKRMGAKKIGTVYSPLQELDLPKMYLKL